MHRITESVKIHLPSEKVFAFLRNVEARLRLNPFYEVMRFEKLTEGDVGAGTRFRIVLLSGGRRAEYESEVLEFVENRKIVSRDTKGRLRLTLTLKETPRGTLLTHDEKFVIPPDALFPEEEEREAPLWMKFLRNLFSIERARFTDREEERRIEEIKKRLAGNLKVWLSLIKERLETEGDGRH
ncbi:MAG: SRPBCC family protein [Nitrospirae bacterium]|nr:SRPBCC family protein [Nitrospirota bacterium]